MKKRIHKYMQVVAISFMAALCISCGNKKEESFDMIEPVIADETVDTETEEIVTGLIAADTILKNKVPWADNDNLFVIENSEVAETTGASLYRFQNDMLLTYGRYDVQKQQMVHHIKRLSIETGEVVVSAQVPMTIVQVQALSEKILIYGQLEGKAIILDEMLQIEGEYDFGAAAAFLEPSGEAVYLLMDDEGIKKVSLNSQEEEMIFASARDMTVGGYGEGCVSFTYIDKDTLLKEAGVLDTRSGSVDTWNIGASCQMVGYGNHTWYGWLHSEERTFVTGDNSMQNLLSIDDSIPAFWDEAGHIVAAQNTEQEYPLVSIYDASGRFISSCMLSNVNWMGWNGEGAWFEELDGYFFTMFDKNGTERLFFWRLSDDVPGSDLETEPYYEPELLEAAGNEVSEELYNRAAALSENYGMRILIADQCDTLIGSYVIEPEEQGAAEATVSHALDALEKALRAYPDGFFKQLLHDHYRQIEIQLLQGSIYSDTMSSASGFVHHEAPGKFIMGLKINGAEDSIIPLEQTIYHEFSHIIDRYLAFEAQYRDDALYSPETWLSLNPEGFVYTGDGDAIYGSVSAYRDYFVDDYACTDEEEDRARTLEYAMMGAIYPDRNTNYYWAETYGTFFQTRGGVNEKLQYYSNCIRDGFDDTGWEEVLPWEAVISK